LHEELPGFFGSATQRPPTCSSQEQELSTHPSQLRLAPQLPGKWHAIRERTPPPPQPLLLYSDLFLSIVRRIRAANSSVEGPGSPPHLDPYQQPGNLPVCSLKRDPRYNSQASTLPGSANPNSQTARVAPDDERKLKFGSSSLEAFAPEHFSTGATEVVVAN
jgi:hypothetical protein